MARLVLKAQGSMGARRRRAPLVQHRHFSSISLRRHTRGRKERKRAAMARLLLKAQGSTGACRRRAPLSKRHPRGGKERKRTAMARLLLKAQGSTGARRRRAPLVQASPTLVSRRPSFSAACRDEQPHRNADRQSATARALDDQSLMAVRLHLRSNASGRRASSTRFICQAASSCLGA